jgi:hypothetical protein
MMAARARCSLALLLPFMILDLCVKSRGSVGVLATAQVGFYDDW